MIKKLLVLFLFLGTGQLLFAQISELSNLRQVVFEIPNGTQPLDSLLVFASSVVVKTKKEHTILDQTHYRIEGRYIHWLKVIDEPVIVSFRIMSPFFGRTFTHLDSSALKKEKIGEGSIIGYNPYAQKDDGLINMKGLNYKGSFSRGLSFGNSQDLVLDSRFNLSLGGLLDNGIEIRAAITDQNLPIQAEGNTRQLKEFDKIFIELKKGKNRLIAGDYELKRPNGYFMNYYKKLQGATFETAFNLSNDALIHTKASAAISRGQFVRNNIIPLEGNQGPYKLQGKEGERFIIILAGTEKVSLDGKQLIRGLEDDYTIDYNQGEITFTSQRIINKDSRIIIEFEYADQRYLRSMYAVNSTYTKNKFKLYFNFFNQQDSRTSTGDVDLNNDQKRQLSLAGDDNNRAIASTLDTLAMPTPERVSYRMAEIQLSCNGQDSLFKYLVYSVAEDSLLFTARFLDVGQGNGNYKLATEQSANERIYQWIPPNTETCLPMGNFEPVGRLVAPQQQQLMTLGTAYAFTKHAGLKVEMALSNTDLNRFSILDSKDDKGVAAFATLYKDFFPGKDSSGWKITTDVTAEWIEANFNPLNPYRSTEFLRDWNLANKQGTGEQEKSMELLLRSGIRVAKKGLGSLAYSFSGFERQNSYRGKRHFTRLSILRKGWQLKAETSLLNTIETERKTQFLRPNFTISKQLAKKGWKIGSFGKREKSERFDLVTDTLSASSFYFDLYGFFLESGQRKNFNFKTKYTHRKDFAPIQNIFAISTDAEDWNINGRWNWRKNLKVNGNFNYRKLRILRQKSTNQKPAETSLGKINILFTPRKLKGALKMNTTYELGAGQEPKQEFTYTEVPAGTGTHVWLDSLYNNDGVIQPHEMEIAPFRDLANYILIRTFTSEYIRTDNVGINQSVEINPKAIWFAQKGVKKFISRIALRSSLRVNRKTQDAPSVETWNPFQLNLADSSLVSVSSIIRNVLFFNQSSTIFNFQLGQTNNNRRFVQTSGFESRSLMEYFFKSRWNINKTWSFNLSTQTGNKGSDSEFFDEKDYNLLFIEAKPQLTYLPSKSFRIKVSYKFRSDEDVLNINTTSAFQKDFSLEATYRKKSNTAINLNFSYIDVSFIGSPNTPVGFAILNGLQNGKNLLWNINLSRQISKNIQLNIGYEGRKTGAANVVHTGRAQVRALF